MVLWLTASFPHSASDEQRRLAEQIAGWTIGARGFFEWESDVQDV